MAEHAVLLTYKQLVLLYSHASEEKKAATPHTLPIGNPPVTTAGLLRPMLLAAKTLKINSSQFHITLPCGVLWIKVTGAAVAEVDAAFMVEFIFFSLIVAEPDSVVVVFRVEFTTSLVTAAESVSVKVAFTVEFVTSPVILLWT